MFDVLARQTHDARLVERLAHPLDQGYRGGRRRLARRGGRRLALRDGRRGRCRQQRDEQASTNRPVRLHCQRTSGRGTAISCSASTVPSPTRTPASWRSAARIDAYSCLRGDVTQSRAVVACCSVRIGVEQR